jgi:transposase
MEHWQKMLDNLSEKSVWTLTDRDAAKYRELSFKNALDFLLHLERADCMKMDPTGKDALLSAKWIRRNLRALDRRGKLEPDFLAQALKALQPENGQGVFPGNGRRLRSHTPDGASKSRLL